MPRRTRPPRLYLRVRRGRAAHWVILDRGREIGTSAGKADIRAAEKALADHIALKRRPDFGDGHPAQVLIADALSEYGEKHAPRTRRPDLIGGAIGKLVDFFGGQSTATITTASCNQYVHWRTCQTDARTAQDGTRIKASTARRELVVLSAALRWCWKEGKLDRPIADPSPPEAEPRERHLTRNEVAALLAGALGWDRRGIRHKTKDESRPRPGSILIGLFATVRVPGWTTPSWACMDAQLGGWRLRRP